MSQKSKLLSREQKKYTVQEETEKNIKEIIAELLLEEKEYRKLEKEAKNNRVLKGFITGKYNNDNLYYYIKGLQILKMIANGGLDAYSFYINSKIDTDKKGLSKEIALRLSRTVLNSAIDILNNKLTVKHEATQNLYMFEQMCKFIGDGRNIVTTEREFDGIKTKQVMTVTEMYKQLEYLVRAMNMKEEATFELYTALGSDAIAFFGGITQLARENKTDAIIMGTLSALNNADKIANLIIREQKLDEMYDELKERYEESRSTERTFLETTPTNKQDMENAKKNAVDAKFKIAEQEIKINDFRDKRRIKSNIIYLGMLGAIVFSEVKKYKGKIQPNELSKIMLSIMSKNRIIDFGSKSVRALDREQGCKRRYKDDLEKVLEMARQIQQKNDELTTPEVKVKSVSFRNFKGEFYKTQVGDSRIPECTVNIPNMKAESGQTILITGNSGSGKSTILKFLRDGDIENRGQIIINDEYRVDKLGTSIVSMCEAKMNLYSYNALQDLTSKTKIKDLTKEEIIKLREIFKDLGLIQNTNEFMEKCEYKTYEQFSTGQQKRLELAKVLFAIDDNSQVILLDETVSNVQKELGEGAFKLIDKYTKKGKPKIVIMVSHDIETASKYADKRYHINEEGTMIEMPVKRKTIEDGPEI